MKLSRILIALLWLSLPSLALSSNSSPYENELLHALDAFLAQDSETATIKLQALIRSYPDSRVAHLLYADLLAAHGSLSSVIDQTMGHLNRDVVSDLRAQLSIRWYYWNNIRHARQGKLPSALLQVAGIHRHVLYMDIPASRLFVFERHRHSLKEIASFYASIGLSGYGKHRRGDQKTPIGVYRITGFIPGKNLHERYGPGALPIDYPNDLDQLYERTGYGIWLHGTEPGFVNRAPLASDGCVSLSNRDFVLLHNLIGDASPVHVILDPAPDWIHREELAIRREELASNLQKWYQAWSIDDQTRLESFYQIPSRTISNQVPHTLSSYKVLLNNSPSFAIKDAHLFAYPGEKNLYVAELFVDSEELSQINIRQYWRLMEGNRWKILIETLIPPVTLKDVEDNTESNEELP